MFTINFASLFICRYPYNWRTPCGYFVTSIILGVLFISEALIYTCCNILYFGACTFLVAFCADFQGLAKFDYEIINAPRCLQISKAESHLKLKRMFGDLVKFHCDMIDLAKKSSSAYK